MRTKTLLLTAALGAVSIATAMAQVYSVNAVGYVNVIIPKGSWKILNNPLDNKADNKIAALMSTAPDDCVVYVWSSGWKTSTMFLGTWDTELTLAPGTGFWFYNPPTATDYTVTFVGDVMQGSPIIPSLSVPVGFSIQGSQVPQLGKLVTDLGFPAPGDDDEVYQWSGGWAVSTFGFGAWDPSEPSIGVAEGFWYNNKNAAKTWSRTFNVNN